MTAKLPSLPPPGVTLEDMIAGFAPTLGREKSEEIVQGAARALGLSGRALDKAGFTAIVERLGAVSGMVGLTARLAGARYARRFTQSSPPLAPRQPAARQPAASSPRPARPAADRLWLISVLSPALGSEKSAELVDDAIGRMGLEGRTVGAAEAHSILDVLAEAPGIVGVAARLARARLAPLEH